MVPDRQRILRPRRGAVESRWPKSFGGKDLRFRGRETDCEVSCVGLSWRKRRVRDVLGKCGRITFVSGVRDGKL